MSKPESLNIKKFAKLCQLSVGTVSGIINKKPGFNAGTIKFVHDKMREHKYQPNPYAQRMQKSALKVISIVCDVEQSFFRSYIIKELIQYLHKQGYNCIVNYLHADEDFDILSVMADTYILTHDCPSIMQQLQKHQLHFIVLDAPQVASKKAYHVDFDRSKAHSDVVDYFLARGHRCFGYIGEKSRKYDEYCLALKKHSIVLQHYARHADPEHSRSMFQEIKRSKQHCAFFIPYEGHALQFAMHCQAHKLQLGQDISAITWGMRYDELLPSANYTRVGCFSDAIGQQILDHLIKPRPARRTNIFLQVAFYDGDSVRTLTNG